MPPPTPPAEGEQRLLVSGVTWDQYESVRAAFDGRPGVRVSYFQGALEIMVPGHEHEVAKKLIARLIEIYALEKNIVLNGAGSETFKVKAKGVGLEPDECYWVGPVTNAPDIAIEVNVSSGGIDKLELYAALGVPEVWIWTSGRLTIHELAAGRFEVRARSPRLPGIDPVVLATFVRKDADQTAAVRAFRDAIR